MVCLDVDKVITERVRAAGTVTAYKLVLRTNTQLRSCFQDFCYRQGWNAARGPLERTKYRDQSVTIDGGVIHVLFNKEDALALQRISVSESRVIKVRCEPADFVEAGHFMDWQSACYKRVWIDQADYDAVLQPRIQPCA